MKLQKECELAKGRGMLIALQAVLMDVLQAMSADEVWGSTARNNDAIGVGTTVSFR